MMETDGDWRGLLAIDRGWERLIKAGRGGLVTIDRGSYRLMRIGGDRGS